MSHTSRRAELAREITKEMPGPGRPTALPDHTTHARPRRFMTDCHRPVATPQRSHAIRACRASGSAREGTIEDVSNLQKIIHNGRVAALVVADQAILVDGLAEDEERTVKAMCLYALEVATGLQPGPYSDKRALEYARRALLEVPQ